jgi:predicted AlkP superfamily pyrophosphatase or phosphodiesterase
LRFCPGSPFQNDVFKRTSLELQMFHQSKGLKGRARVGRVLFVLSDALGYEVAVAGMGYLGHLVEVKRASLYKVIGELPGFSRPMYETTHTGLPVSEHGIVSNGIVRCSNQPNIFQLAVDAGRTTAAAAYCWFSELYNRAPYDRINDREVDDCSMPIQHGRFYAEDDFPDSELCDAALFLVRKYAPDYLLAHPMGMDLVGERHGYNSSEYRNHAIHQGIWMTQLLTECLQKGYNILVSGDHGMGMDGEHGGTRPEMREVPLYLIQPDAPGKGDTKEVISQLRIAPTICRFLDVPIPSTMKHAPVV